MSTKTKNPSKLDRKSTTYAKRATQDRKAQRAFKSTVQGRKGAR